MSGKIKLGIAVLASYLAFDSLCYFVGLDHRALWESQSSYHCRMVRFHGKDRPATAIRHFEELCRQGAETVEVVIDHVVEDGFNPRYDPKLHELLSRYPALAVKDAQSRLKADRGLPPRSKLRLWGIVFWLGEEQQRRQAIRRIAVLWPDKLWNVLDVEQFLNLMWLDRYQDAPPIVRHDQINREFVKWIEGCRD